MQQTSFIAPYQRARLQGLPLRERPSGRIARHGASALSLIELMAALVGGGNQLEIAENLVSRYRTLGRLSNAPLAELEKVHGLGRATAARLKAALELGRRLLAEPNGDRPQVRCPADAANLVLPEMGLLEQEEVRVILLDTRNRVLDIHTVYKGSLNTSLVRVAELFREAIRQNAAAVILVHNHPSSDTSCSPEDAQLTASVVEAGDLLGIELLDHLIVGGGKFTSLKEKGLGFA